MLKYLKRVLQEMVPVILGILIALFINNWKEDRANEKFVEKALITISTEVAENHSSVSEILPRHYQLLEQLIEEADNDSLTIAKIITDAGGVQLPTIRSASWKFFLNSKTELIDYPVISALIEMDESKRVMDIKFEQFLTYAYQYMNASDREGKELFIAYFSNLVDSEETLQALCEAYLSKEAKTE